MAAATRSRAALRKDSDQIRYPIAAAAKLFKDTLVFLAAGNLIPARTGTATDKFAGVVMSDHDNTAGAAGAKEAIIRKTGTYAFNFGSTPTVAVNGAPIYASNDQDVTTVSTGAILIGYGIYDPEIAGQNMIRVRIDGAVN